MESSTPEKLTSKTISVIIPVFNREDTLLRLFNSLSHITYRPLEIVLIDNQSTDHSLALCKAFQEEIHQSEHFSVIVGSEPHPGACAARNLGIHLAHGDYLYFFDSDDEISPDFFEELAPYLSSYDLLCAPTRMRFEDGTQKTRTCIPTAQPYDHILSASLSTQSFIIRRDFLQSIGCWDTDIKRWNDWELGVRILCHQPRLKWLSKKAYHTIYQHTESISGKSFSEDCDALLKSLEKATYDIQQSSLSEKTKSRSFNAMAGKYLLLAAHIHQEGHHELAQKIYKIGMGHSQCPIFKKEASLLYALARRGVPRIWKLLLYLV